MHYGRGVEKALNWHSAKVAQGFADGLTKEARSADIFQYRLCALRPPHSCYLLRRSAIWSRYDNSNKEGLCAAKRVAALSVSTLFR